MATTLKYNGVTLQQCQTQSFTQSAQYDPSNSDVIFWRYNIKVATVCKLATFTRDLGVKGIAADSAGIFAQLESRLMQSRGELIYSIGDTVLLKANGFSPGLKRKTVTDVDNGPKPKNFSISMVAGEIVSIEFEIEAAIVVCSGAILTQGGQSGIVNTGGHVLNNRWSLEDTIDESHFTTRTWRGVLRCSHPNFPAHLWRNLCVPPVLDGYRRTSQQFTSDPSGLILNYTVTDKQEFAAAPHPAVKWTCTHTESTDYETVGRSQVSVKLWGGPQAKKEDLLERCAQVIRARLGDLTRGHKAEDKNAGNIPIVSSAAFIEQLHENSMELRVEVMNTPRDPLRYLNMAIADRVKKPYLEQLGMPNYDHAEHIAPASFDPSTPAGVFAQYAQTPCIDDHAVPQARNLESKAKAKLKEREKAGAVKFFRATTGKGLDLAPPEGYSFSHKSAPYTDVVMESRYDIDHGIVQAPIAKAKPKKGEASSAIGKLHAAIARRVLNVKMVRIGTQPELPLSPEEQRDPNGIKEVLISTQPILHAPQIMPDGKVMRYTTEFEHTYALERAPTQEEILRVPSSPADVTKPKEIRLTKSGVGSAGLE